MSGCIFCAILSGQLPASRVYEDEVGTAFMDIQPVNPAYFDKPNRDELDAIAEKIKAALSTTS